MNSTLNLSELIFFMSRTRHHTGESYGPLSNEISSNGIMIPHLETNQGDPWHLNTEDEGLLPHWVET